MGKLIRDDNWTNTLWCKCTDEQEFYQFAKDLFLFRGMKVCGSFCSEIHWVRDAYDWSELFGVEVMNGEDKEKKMFWREAVDPIDGEYEITIKPKQEEYPVVVHYDSYHKRVTWMSLDKMSLNPIPLE